MEEQGGKWTRRKFLHMVGLAGGSVAVYESMVALGMLRTPLAYAGPPKLPDGSGAGKSVLILGAGVGGLTAAYELQKVGYDVWILEATARTGGRSHTVRQGDTIEQIGRPDQVCQFDDPSLYLNAGPGRIPYHHQAVLSYCRELNVELQVYVMETRANLFQTPAQKAFDGQPVKNRRVANDTRGYISELLAKAVNKNALDKELDGVDRAKLLDLLSVFGDVDAAQGYKYEGSSRSGYDVEPGVVEPGDIVKPLDFKRLVSSEFWRHRFYQPEDYEWQTTLFQPVGGMDKFAHALADQVKDRIIKNAEVLQVYNGDDGVRVVYRDRVTGAQSEKRADYCISNIPLPLARKVIAKDTFSDDYKKAAGTVTFANTCKVGWQANERFWESKENQIFGGISWIDHPMTQMWYPSNDYFSRKGVLTGTYNYDSKTKKTAEQFGKLSFEDRLRLAREGAERLHPDFAKHVPMELGLSIAWQMVPFQEGGWSDWDWTKPEQQAAYDRLLEPDKRFQVVGDQVSYLPGWQEGAVLSAHHVIEKIAGLERAPMLRKAAGTTLRRRARRITGADVE
jgi:monoamine oxidase